MAHLTRILAIGAAAATIALTGCSSEEPTTETTEEAPAETQEAPAEEPADDGTQLAEDVEAAILTNFGGVDSFQDLDPSSQAYAITEIEGVNSSTVRVHVQQDLDETGEEDLARMVFGLASVDVPDLDTVVIQDTSGVDANFYKSDFPSIG